MSIIQTRINPSFRRSLLREESAINGASKASCEHREKVRQAVRKVMMKNPLLSIKQVAAQTGHSYGIVSTAYYQFKRGEL